MGGDALFGVEYQRVMGNYEVAVFVGSLGDDFRGYVNAEEYAGARGERCADLEPGVVEVFLVTWWEGVFDNSYYVADKDQLKGVKGVKGEREIS